LNLQFFFSKGEIFTFQYPGIFQFVQTPLRPEIVLLTTLVIVSFFRQFLVFF